VSSQAYVRGMVLRFASSRFGTSKLTSLPHLQGPDQLGIRIKSATGVCIESIFELEESKYIDTVSEYPRTTYSSGHFLTIRITSLIPVEVLRSRSTFLADQPTIYWLNCKISSPMLSLSVLFAGDNGVI